MVLAALSCGSQPKAALSNSTQRAAELAGNWTLSVWLPTHGTVVASLQLEESGHGQYLVTATDLKRSGDLRIIAWNGEWLEASVAGGRQRIRAILQGGILYVELPVVGQVKLIRQSPQRGPLHFSDS